MATVSQNYSDTERMLAARWYGKGDVRCEKNVCSLQFDTLIRFQPLQCVIGTLSSELHALQSWRGRQADANWQGNAFRYPSDSSERPRVILVAFSRPVDISCRVRLLGMPRNTRHPFRTPHSSIIETKHFGIILSFSEFDPSCKPASRLYLPKSQALRKVCFWSSATQSVNVLTI